MADDLKDILRLPPVLYHRIARWCDKRTWDSLSKTSKAWRFQCLAAKFRFSRIKIDDNQLGMEGALRVFNYGRRDPKLDAFRCFVKRAVFIVRGRVIPPGPRVDPDLDVPEEQDTPLEDLPASLADALFRLKNLQSLTLLLENFSAEQVDSLNFAFSQKEVIWRKVHSLRIKAPTEVVKSVISSCDPGVLTAINLYKWHGSEEFAALKKVKRLKRLRLLYDDDNGTLPSSTLPCASEDLWHALHSLYIETGKSLEWLILHEKRNRNRSRITHIYQLDQLIATINFNIKKLKEVKRFAFSLQSKRVAD
ncbi:hypothetical protein F53441_14358 [Fusarium austroafricanum]|uniref:F-box domain-containing protein n=1 Tax=Fusarium austroafricanum TaxID=2364996 RepID=A0A8H4JEF7_9HYPO|nr:hypothetical protein F53441_14358 [Fusarium austroafricanum]